MTDTTADINLLTATATTGQDNEDSTHTAGPNTKQEPLLIDFGDHTGSQQPAALSVDTNLFLPSELPVSPQPQPTPVTQPTVKKTRNTPTPKVQIQSATTKLPYSFLDDTTHWGETVEPT